MYQIYEHSKVSCIFKGGDLDDLLSFVAGEVKNMGCLDQQSGWRSVNYNWRFDLKISFQVSTSVFFDCHLKLTAC